MRRYFTCLAAYLTGWVIAQTIFSRLWSYMMRESESESYEQMSTRIALKTAVATANELEARGMATVVGARHEEFADAMWERLRVNGYEPSRLALREAARDLWGRLA